MRPATFLDFWARVCVCVCVGEGGGEVEVTNVMLAFVCPDESCGIFYQEKRAEAAVERGQGECTFCLDHKALSKMYLL